MLFIWRLLFWFYFTLSIKNSVAFIVIYEDQKGVFFDLHAIENRETSLSNAIVETFNVIERKKIIFSHVDTMTIIQHLTNKRLKQQHKDLIDQIMPRLETECELSVMLIDTKILEAKLTKSTFNLFIVDDDEAFIEIY